MCFIDMFQVFTGLNHCFIQCFIIVVFFWALSTCINLNAVHFCAMKLSSELCFEGVVLIFTCYCTLYCTAEWIEHFCGWAQPKGVVDMDTEFRLINEVM